MAGRENCTHPDPEPRNGPHARSLPQSAEGERAVLAAVLLAPDVLPTVAGRLQVDDFYFERHQLIYQAMLELTDDGNEIDLRTLQDRLQRTGGYERVGGMAFLAGLDLDLPDFSRAGTYVEMIKERSIRRRLMKALQSLTEDCFDGQGVDASEALRRAEATVLDLGTEASRRDLMPLAELFEDTARFMENRMQGDLLGVPSGFPDLDRLSEGLVPGSLIVLAGRPGMGKTSLALDIARNVALHQALPVALFSLEMSRLELCQRLLSSEAALPFADVRAARLNEEQWRTLYDTLSRGSGAPLFVDDSASPSVLEIASKAKLLKAEKGLSLVIVDYLQLLQMAPNSKRRAENRQQEITALSRAFKVLAKELQVPVLLLSQLSRKPEERIRNHRPVLSDLRESGAIEQDADMVCFVYRQEMYDKDDTDVKGLAELIVEKNRNGPTGTVDLVFLAERATFMSRART